MTRVSPLMTQHALRLSLALIFLGFGYAKFFPYEVEGIAPFVHAHPLLNWMLPLIGEAGVASFLGVAEILTGLLVLAGFRWRFANLAGGLLTLITFATTLTLFLFLPGLFEASAGGFPALSGTGQFLLKDTLAFSAGLFLLTHAQQTNNTSQ